jgi:hypothetical protein
MNVPEPYCRQAAALAGHGYGIGTALTDGASPAKGCPLHVLDLRRGHIPPGNWPVEDVRLLSEALRAFVGVAACQVQGLGALLASGPPVHLHPLATLVRSIAEACGWIWWHVEPWLNDAGDDAELEPAEWDQLSQPILARIELIRLDGLTSRQRRHRASHGEDSAEYRASQAAVAAYKDQLRARHDPSRVVLSGDRRRWRICGQGLPEITKLVTAATEYAYGQDTRGSGSNPYPMYSAYAHASLETVFASAGTGRPPLSQLLMAEEVDLRRLVAAGTRTFAAGYEIASHAFGLDVTELRAWEDELAPLTLG